MVNGTPREAAFLVCLSEAYELAGRKVSDTTILSAAKEMASRIPCQDNEIKELFATAREFNDIPTLKVLWKAFNYINENRPMNPSTTLTYDKSSRLMQRINFKETLKILAHKLGRYAEMCYVYQTDKIDGKYQIKFPGLKEKFDSEMIPMMEKICGQFLGENPNLPNHPIQRYVAR